MGTAFSWAFSAFGRSAGTWLVAALLLGVLSSLVSWMATPSLREVFSGNLGDIGALETALQVQLTFQDVLLAAAGDVVTTVLVAFLLNGALVATRQGRARLGELFAVRDLGQVVVLAAILVVINLVLSFVPLVGWLLSVVVGFMLAASLLFVLDQGQDAVTALRSSWAFTRQHLGAWLLTAVLAVVVLVVGFLALFVGSLVAFPVAALMVAHMYRRLTGGQVAQPA
ncbi:hypothetical protein DNL40_05850 [Xylanimonas oleitrophica]|uniref:Integral membrane protein n=1 Tax=Xylanimonas oleitrophica TaxID=2607479 RepID=A0A2W5WQS0_9MICO|nr:hypothetical protein DNL40_05850 [Xylanimonas oleitrophica]